MIERLIQFAFGRLRQSSYAKPTCGRLPLALLADMDHCNAETLCELVSRLEVRFNVYIRLAIGAHLNGQVDALGLAGIRPVPTFPQCHGKAATDTRIALEAVQQIPRASAYCINSCDGDAAGLIHWLREQGKYVIVAAPSASVSRLSRQVANEFIDTDSLLPAPVPPVEPSGAKPGRRSPCHKTFKGEHNIDELVQEIRQTLNLLAASSRRPTLRDLEAAHLAAHPEFTLQDCQFLKGNPPRLTPAHDFVDLIRSTKAFCIERVPTTSGALKNYYLQFRK